MRAARDERASEPEAPDGASPRTRDRGFTLVEVVMTIVIMSLVTVPVLNAFIVAIRTSASATDRSHVETVLHNAADRVNRAPKSCDYLIYAQAAAQSEGWNGSTATVTQKYYVPGATATAVGQWVTAPNASACSGSTPKDLEVQLVSITISSPNGVVRKTIEVIKSDV